MHRMRGVTETGEDGAVRIVTRAVEMTAEEEAAFIADQQRIQAKIAARPKPRNALVEIDAIKARLAELEGKRA